MNRKLNSFFFLLSWMSSLSKMSISVSLQFMKFEAIESHLYRFFWFGSVRFNTLVLFAHYFVLWAHGMCVCACVCPKCSRSKQILFLFCLFVFFLLLFCCCVTYMYCNFTLLQHHVQNRLHIFFQLKFFSGNMN